MITYDTEEPTVQILLWDYSDPCNMFPTLFFDLGVDSFFLVCPEREGRVQAHRRSTREKTRETGHSWLKKLVYR